jgi:UDP-N-acetylmuramate dehydrogenase
MTDALQKLEARLKEIPQLALKRDAPLNALSRWRIGGPADLLAEPKSEEALSETLRIIAAARAPCLVIGGASNLLFDDKGLRGVVVRIGSALSAFSADGTRVRAQAGLWTPQFARMVGRAGLSGVEHTIGIPGTLGGLIAMNGGSQRKGIGDNLVRARCLDKSGNALVLSRSDCRFAYRSSTILARELVIVSAEFEFSPRSPVESRHDMIAIMASRRKKFPRHVPNCGSVFLSDPSMYETAGPPGKAIEEAGLRGKRIGGAQVASNHGNFIVNLGHASSGDVLALIGAVRTAVHARTGYWLSCEVRYVSPDCSVRQAHLACMDSGHGMI